MIRSMDMGFFCVQMEQGTKEIGKKERSKEKENCGGQMVSLTMVKTIKEVGY